MDDAVVSMAARKALLLFESRFAAGESGRQLHERALAGNKSKARTTCQLFRSKRICWPQTDLNGPQGLGRAKQRVSPGQEASQDGENDWLRRPATQRRLDLVDRFQCRLVWSSVPICRLARWLQQTEWPRIAQSRQSGAPP